MYTKTMFELNRAYGWTKFIIVVPGVAIREGVFKSLQTTEQHFFEQYGKRINFFVYDSNNLTELDRYSESSDICAMIINMQAFNTSMKEGGRSKQARIIFDERDEFGSRRPIDVIAANRPIIIQDEPQKMGGKATQNGIRRFNPLFCLNYSATHRVRHNMVYVLDALDAYNQRLVKRIEVKGFELKHLPEELRPYADHIEKVARSVYDPHALDGMASNGHETKVDNLLNDNFRKREFQELWHRINSKHAYTVSFDDGELRRKAIDHINRNLTVSTLSYTLTTGSQTERATRESLDARDQFGNVRRETKELDVAASATVTYDLVGEIAQGAHITRRSAVAILKGLDPLVFSYFKRNPEEFIAKVARYIVEQKATMIVEHIEYHTLEDRYDQDIFAARMPENRSRVFEATKNVQDYVVCDSDTEVSFGHELEEQKEVCVYARLPRGFTIPTPVGNYAPDWAVAFHEGTVRHIFFVAETKGSMDTLHLDAVENAKIACAEKLFNEMSAEGVKYHQVATYDDMTKWIERL